MNVAGFNQLGTANTYTGGTTISGGTLQLLGGADLAGGGLTANGGTLDLNGNSIAVSSLGGTAGTITDNTYGGLTSTLTVNQSGTSTFGGAIQDSGNGQIVGLTMAGSGRLILTGGVEQLQRRHQYQRRRHDRDPKRRRPGHRRRHRSQRRRQLAFNMSGQTVANANIWLNGTTTIGGLGGALAGNISGTAGNNTLSGTLHLGSGWNNVSTANAGSLTLGKVTGTGGLEIDAYQAGGSPLVILSSSQSDFSGGIMVNAGTLQTNGPSVIPSGTGKGDVTVASGANLNLGGQSQTVNGLWGPGTVSAGSGTATLSLGAADANSTFPGVIANGGGTLSLAKLGGGTIILTGANTYTGGTAISGGTLQIGNATATGALSATGAITDNASLAFNRTNAVTQGADFSAAPITGSGTVSQLGSGTLTLNAANSYQGGTVINAGTLNVNADAALGTCPAPRPPTSPSPAAAPSRRPPR